MPQRTTMTEGLPETSGMVRVVRADGPDWDTDCRPVVRRAPAGIIRGGMAEDVDRRLGSPDGRGGCGRRNGTYRRRLLCEPPGDIEPAEPRILRKAQASGVSCERSDPFFRPGSRRMVESTVQTPARPHGSKDRVDAASGSGYARERSGPAAIGHRRSPCRHFGNHRRPAVPPHPRCRGRIPYPNGPPYPTPPIGGRSSCRKRRKYRGRPRENPEVRLPGIAPEGTAPD